MSGEKRILLCSLSVIPKARQYFFIDCKNILDNKIHSNKQNSSNHLHQNLRKNLVGKLKQEFNILIFL
ncbi:MAG: hypothetical protein GAK29_03200 [Acinetobacter bereziniae]|uniref:Uncharacterized protein n=1 Tax=Acinetobacter bereziniae TaxID=106648 RepID=A0A833PCZ9_ACIBZ|nr:MAG: hypothetical protein GAK29_03200 [Acinetobacter bereziniae]